MDFEYSVIITGEDGVTQLFEVPACSYDNAVDVGNAYLAHMPNSERAIIYKGRTFIEDLYQN